MKLVRDSLLAILSMAAFVLLVELCLRVAGVHYESSLYSLNRDFGYVLRPGAAGWSVKDRENYEQISSQGLRDRYHRLQRAADTIRIAVVGDSFSEAKQVDQDRAYWSVLERELNKRLEGGTRRVDVVNFGVAGYGLPQDYLVIKQKIWQFDPQIVLLTGTLHSLILDSSRRFATVQVSGGPTPYFVRSGGGLVLDEVTLEQRRAFVPPTRVSDFIEDLSNESRVVSLLNAVRRTVKLDLARLPHPFDAPGDGPKRDGLSYENTVLRGPTDAEFADTWKVAEDLIRLSDQEVTRHRAEFWFVLLDMAPQCDPDPRNRDTMRHSLGIDDLFLADRAFGAFATRQGIKHALLAPGMLAVAEKKNAVLHGFPNHPRNSGHWNESGHEAAGQLLAERLFNCSTRFAGQRAREPRAPGGCADDFLQQ
jgi:hypothetical protein